VTVTDDLDVGFSAGKGEPLLCGIEIVAE